MSMASQHTSMRTTFDYHVLAVEAREAAISVLQW